MVFIWPIDSQSLPSGLSGWTFDSEISSLLLRDPADKQEENVLAGLSAVSLRDRARWEEFRYWGLHGGRD